MSNDLRLSFTNAEAVVKCVPVEMLRVVAYLLAQDVKDICLI